MVQSGCMVYYNVILYLIILCLIRIGVGDLHICIVSHWSVSDRPITQSNNEIVTGNNHRILSILHQYNYCLHWVWGPSAVCRKQFQMYYIGVDFSEKTKVLARCGPLVLAPAGNWRLDDLFTALGAFWKYSQRWLDLTFYIVHFNRLKESCIRNLQN